MNHNARTWLEMPEGLPGMNPEVQRALNERFRTIAADLASSSAAAAAGGSAGGRQLILTVPGTLGVRIDAAPRVELAAAASVVEIRALLKRPSEGANVRVSVRVANVVYTSIEIAALAIEVGKTTRLVAIPPNQVITLDVVQVGTTFPGADLSLLLRF